LEQAAEISGVIGLRQDFFCGVRQVEFIRGLKVFDLPYTGLLV
jgi:hypothetical protein